MEGLAALREIDKGKCVDPIVMIRCFCTQGRGESRIVLVFGKGRVSGC